MPRFFCPTCARDLYLDPGGDPTCPVCSDVLFLGDGAASAEMTAPNEARSPTPEAQERSEPRTA